MFWWTTGIVLYLSGLAHVLLFVAGATQSNRRADALGEGFVRSRAGYPVSHPA